MLMKNMTFIKNSITILVSLILSLLIIELFLRAFYPQNLSGSWRVIDNNGLIMNKSKGESIQMYGARKAKYSFEDFGVRSSYKPTNNPKKKILVLGDSFTFGWLLNIEDTFVELLAKNNDDMIFLNAAAGGWGASDYTAYMETYCKKVKPDTALIVMNGSDINRMLVSSLYNFDIKSNSVHRSVYIQSSKDRLKSFLNNFSLYQMLLENLHLLQLVRSSYIASLSPGIEENSVTFGLMSTENLKYSNQFSATLFQYLNRISKDCGCDLRIVYSGITLIENDEIYPTLEFVNFAKNTKFFEKLGIRFADLTNTPQIKKYRGELSKFTIVGDGHPNEAGARLLYEALHQSGILID